MESIQPATQLCSSTLSKASDTIRDPDGVDDIARSQHSEDAIVGVWPENAPLVSTGDKPAISPKRSFQFTAKSIRLTEPGPHRIEYGSHRFV
jgi:hypothetical protein